MSPPIFHATEVIVISVAYFVLLAAVVVVSFCLYFYRNKLLSKWKAAKFHIWTCVGLVILLAANELDLIFCIVDVPFPWWVSIIYHIGFDFCFIPILLRSWRVVTLLASTPTFRGIRIVMSPTMQLRTMSWFNKRLALLMIVPFGLPAIYVAIAVPLHGDVGYLDKIMQAYDGVIMVLMCIVFCWLVAIRRRVMYEELDERKELFLLCGTSLFFFIEDLVMFYVMIIYFPYEAWLAHFLARYAAMVCVFAVTGLLSVLQIRAHKGKRLTVKKAVLEMKAAHRSIAVPAAAVGPRGSLVVGQKMPLMDLSDLTGSPMHTFAMNRNLMTEVAVTQEEMDIDVPAGEEHEMQSQQQQHPQPQPQPQPQQQQQQQQPVCVFAVTGLLSVLQIRAHKGKRLTVKKAVLEMKAAHRSIAVPVAAVGPRELKIKQRIGERYRVPQIKPGVPCTIWGVGPVFATHPASFCSLVVGQKMPLMDLSDLTGSPMHTFAMNRNLMTEVAVTQEEMDIDVPAGEEHEMQPQQQQQQPQQQQQQQQQLQQPSGTPATVI
ncbi:hypothetical protein PAPYR_10723 [Paratrimastix pyriformis]|uniref:Uncharacterized protein n=1 Tax=Paratrimastix pyriformis TaxID=342808 RepID=A0ABQ8U746_9EUKA|nr:hypothetical protein PAPYR_10723 [Paratrimastix pyriformis]